MIEAIGLVFGIYGVVAFAVAVLHWFFFEKQEPFPSKFFSFYLGMTWLPMLVVMAAVLLRETFDE